MLSLDEIKKLTNLKQKKYRQKYNKFLVEGVRLLEEALAMGTVETLYYTNDLSFSRRKKLLVKEANKKNILIKKINDKVLKKISNTVSNQGVVGVALIPEDRSTKFEDNWIYLDQIHDPGNLGTIIRTADWFGVRNLALSHSSADPYNPKVVRSGMGAHFRLTIRTSCDLDKIKSAGYIILAADTRGEPIQTFSLPRELNWCLVMGSEAVGISEKNKGMVDNSISIPGCGNSDSLNVGVATGILLNHLIENNHLGK